MRNEMFTRLGNGSDWPRAGVFDCDGVLIESASAWEAAYHAIAAEIGASAADLQLGRLRGASVATATAALTKQLGRRIDENLVRRQLVDAFARNRPAAMPGARILLERVGGRLPLAVASNGPSDLVLAALRGSGLLDFFMSVACAELIGNPKPAPDVYLYACRRLAVDPSDAIAFEDSAVGARAARDAGLTVVVIGAEYSVRRDADLAVRSLDDPRILELFGIDAARTVAVRKASRATRPQALRPPG
jgi:HAD superfamily hydrolase (TIGR01509 family)